MIFKFKTRLVSGLFLVIPFCLISLTSYANASFTTKDVKDPIYDKIKKEAKYSFSNVFLQTNIYNKPTQNLPLPTATSTFPKENRIVIPSIQMNLKIMDVDSINKVSHGAWRVSDSSTPDKGGNTVIIGHRISLAGGVEKPWDFFFLPEVKEGNVISVYWKGVKYNYKITKATVEDPDNSNIEDSTTENTITVYTCYPLWTTDYRFAIQGTLQSVEKANKSNI